MRSGIESHARAPLGRLAPVMVLLLIGCHLLACAQPAVRESETPVPSALAVTAMSFNVRWDGFDDGGSDWEHRRELAFDVIRNADPDVVGLQESSDAQVANFLRALPRYRAFNSGDRSRVVTILYRADRFRLVRGGAIWLISESDLSGGTRRCTWVRLAERTTGLEFLHFNLHLDHRSLPSRERSAVVLSRYLALLAPAEAFVVTGDFNTTEDSPPMKYLRGEVPLPGEDGSLVRNPVQLVDSFRVLYPDAKEVGTGHGFRGGRRGRKIDYVLVRPSARVTMARIVHDERDGLYPSDHYPVLARLLFASENSPGSHSPIGSPPLR